MLKKYDVKKSRKRCVSTGMALILAELLVIYLCIIGNSILKQNKKSQRMLLTDDVGKRYHEDTMKDAESLYPSRLQREIQELDEVGILKLKECAELFNLLSQDKDIEGKMAKSEYHSELIAVLMSAAKKASKCIFETSHEDKELLGQIGSVLSELVSANIDEKLVLELISYMEQLKVKGFLLDKQMSTLLTLISTKYYDSDFKEIPTLEDIEKVHSEWLLKLENEDLQKYGDMMRPLFLGLIDGSYSDVTLYEMVWSLNKDRDIAIPEENLQAIIQDIEGPMNELVILVTDEEKAKLEELVPIFEAFTKDKIGRVARLFAELEASSQFSDVIAAVIQLFYQSI